MELIALIRGQDNKLRTLKSKINVPNETHNLGLSLIYLKNFFMQTTNNQTKEWNNILNSKALNILGNKKANAYEIGESFITPKGEYIISIALYYIPPNIFRGNNSINQKELFPWIPQGKTKSLEDKISPSSKNYKKIIKLYRSMSNELKISEKCIKIPKGAEYEFEPRLLISDYLPTLAKLPKILFPKSQSHKSPNGQYPNAYEYDGGLYIIQKEKESDILSKCKFFLPYRFYWIPDEFLTESKNNWKQEELFPEKIKKEKGLYYNWARVEDLIITSNNQEEKKIS